MKFIVYALFVLLAIVAVSAKDDKPTLKYANMNGEYLIANPNTGSPVKWTSDYASKGVEYFEVYSPPIRTVYGEVYWTMMDPVPLPKDIVTRFVNKTMVMVGYEADQVFVTPNGDVSVPIYWSYNHHYCAWLLGKDAKLVEVTGGTPRDTAYNHGSRNFWKVISDPNPFIGAIPNSQFISEGNGGEYRKSFHGYPRGVGQFIHSPTTFHIQPMQIDTHNRDYKGPGFKAGILPKSSQAPVNATYSGLLECPCTTRVKKVYGMTYSTKNSENCQTNVANASLCFSAASAIVKTNLTRIVSDKTLPSGCFIMNNRDGTNVIYNTMNTPTKCSGGIQLTASATSLVKLGLQLDTTVKGGRVLINITGPSDVWFGVGFQATIMGDQPYTIIVDGTGKVQERKLGDHAPGTPLAPQVVLVSSSVHGNQRTVVLSRAFKGISDNHYTFDPAHSVIPFINAIGSTPDLSYHQDKATATLTLYSIDGNTCVCYDGIKGTLNGLAFNKYCAPEPIGDLVQQANPTCWIQTYAGGLECCHHQNILLDAEQPVDQRIDEIHLKFRFYFEEYIPPTPARPQPSHYNLDRFYFTTEAFAGEYDIVKCKDGVPPEDCIQEITARWKVKDMFYDCNVEKDANCTGTGKGIKLMYAGGHCHAPSCLSIELYNADTGALLCRQVPVFGRGGEDKYDENGYIAIPPCLWGDVEEGLVPPELLSLETNLMSVKRNNNTYGHYGEMASWQMRGLVF